MTSKLGTRPEDRRTSERVPARVEVRFQERTTAAKAFRAFSLNFSMGGICLKTDKQYATGARLKLTIEIGGEEHDLDGIVSWVRGGAVGIRFDAGTEQDRQRIARIMDAIRVQ
jgi:uncharacterized protein (TIGR02266 family)